MEGRDRYALSNDHSIEGYLAILADKGYFTKEMLETYCQLGSDLIGHPNNKIRGIEVNTGALGHGLSIGAGMALGLKRTNRNNHGFVLMGDGELDEDSIWEATMAASHYKLDNLTGIIDRNRLQISGDTEGVMALQPLADRWKTFGWSVKEIDGHDMDEIMNTLAAVPFAKGKPSIVIA